MADMISSNLDKANRLYEIGMKNIKLQLVLLGTEFVVLRPKNNSKWKNVFGGTYSSNPTLENDYDQFTTKLILNHNELRDVWNRNRDTLEVILMMDLLKLVMSFNILVENIRFDLK